jgi:hypothetical protein
MRRPVNILDVVHDVIQENVLCFIVFLSRSNARAFLLVLTKRPMAHSHMTKSLYDVI